MDGIRRGKIRVIARSIGELREQVRELWLEENAKSSAGNLSQDAGGYLGAAVDLHQDAIDQLDGACDSSQETAIV